LSFSGRIDQINILRAASVISAYGSAAKVRPLSVAPQNIRACEEFSGLVFSLKAIPAFF